MAGEIGKDKLLLLGGVLLTALAGWILFTVTTNSVVAPSLPARGLGIRGILDDEMPVKQMESSLQVAHDVVNHNYLWAHRFSWGSRVCDWIGFGLTSLITIFAGIQGKSLRADDGSIGASGSTTAVTDHVKPRRKRGRPATWVRIIGGIAALSAMSIALSTRLNADYARKIENAEQLLTVADAARVHFVDATSPAEGHQVMNDLKKEIERRR